MKFYFYVNLGEYSQVDVSYSGITLRKVKEYTYADLTLRSLPNGIKDEIKNNKFIKRIESYTLNGTEDWVLADGTKANTNSFSCQLPNAVPVDKAVISINSNKYKNTSDEELYVEDILGLAIGGLNSNRLIFRVSKGLDSVDKLKNHLSIAERDITIEYEIKEEVYDIDLAITCPPGETIFIDTNDNLTFSHQVQLNTKSQIEETQKQIVKSNKSIWQKFKELTDVKMKLENTGYIKLPTALGGVILQWGIISPTLSNYGSDTYIDFPVHFSNKVFNIQTSCSGKAPGFAQEVFVSAYNTNNYGTRILVKDKQHESPTIYVSWFAIGK